MRQGFATRTTPRRPEVEEHDLALQIIERNAAPVRCRHGKGRRHPRTRKLRLADVSQRPLPVGIVLGLHFYELLEPNLGGVVLFHVRERLTVREHCVRKVRDRRQRLGELVMDAAVHFILVPDRGLAHQHYGQLIMRDSYISLALSLRHHLRCGGFGSLPLLELKRILDDFLLAVQTVPAILLVGLLEAVQRKIRPALIQKCNGLLVRLFRLLVRRPIRVRLRQRRRHKASHQPNQQQPHTTLLLPKISVKKLSRLGGTCEGF